MLRRHLLSFVSLSPVAAGNAGNYAEGK